MWERSKFRNGEEKEDGEVSGNEEDVRMREVKRKYGR